MSDPSLPRLSLTGHSVRRRICIGHSLVLRSRTAGLTVRHKRNTISGELVHACTSVCLAIEQMGAPSYVHHVIDVEGRSYDVLLMANPRRVNDVELQ